MDGDGIVRRGWLAFGLGCAAVLLMTLISEGAHWQSSRTLDRLDAMAQVPASLQALQWSLLDAVAARREAPDTGAAAQARHQVALALAALDEHFRGRPEARAA
ncbi:MAG: hypothetical protein KGJ24_00865, partial [Burkholderiales bacterium]|nr:hypothetical protein [Burkholderiales bacterium]